MTRTFEIVKEIVAKMDLTIHVKSINGDILFVCKTLHLRKGSIIKDDQDNEFRVVDFSNNHSVEIEPLGNYVWSGNIINCPPPTFLQGHAISANHEYLQMSADTRAKTPLIWLVRGYEELHGGVRMAVTMDVTPLIYFLDEADFNNWLNDDHDKNAVNPMYNLAELFVETVEKQKNIVPTADYRITDEPRFGVKLANNRGTSERIISDDLSGVGLRIRIKKLSNCKTC